MVSAQTTLNNNRQRWEFGRPPVFSAVTEGVDLSHSSYASGSVLEVVNSCSNAEYPEAGDISL